MEFKMSYMKPVIREPYYDKPIWIENEVTRKEFTFLSSNSSEAEVELFLLHLFGYNRIDASISFEESFKELLMEDEVAILGGVAFLQDDETFIMPSCCCGLEEIQSIDYSIKAKQSPWLGHDPSPGIQYFDDYALVWSDDPETLCGHSSLIRQSPDTQHTSGREYTSLGLRRLFGEAESADNPALAKSVGSVAGAP